jgi:hypothetical protein
MLYLCWKIDYQVTNSQVRKFSDLVFLAGYHSFSSKGDVCDASFKRASSELSAAFFQDERLKKASHLMILACCKATIGR